MRGSWHYTLYVASSIEYHDSRSVLITYHLPQQYGMQDSSNGGVQIKCDKKQEAMSYTDLEAHLDAMTQLKRFVGRLPTYFIYGGRIDLMCAPPLPVP